MNRSRSGKSGIESALIGVIAALILGTLTFPFALWWELLITVSVVFLLIFCIFILQSNPKNVWIRALSLIGLCLLAGLVGSTTLRIEVLNHEAGGVLPRDIESMRGSRKWRVAKETEAFWVYVLLDQPYDERDAGELLATLNDEQRWELSNLVNRAKAHNELRRLTAFAVQQYVLAPLLLVLSVGMAGIFKRNPGYVLACISCSVAALTSGFFMFFRAYFTSVGA